MTRPDPRTVGIFDQLDATLKNFAPLVTAYFRSLLQAGLPYELAYDLTVRWHDNFWEGVMRHGLAEQSPD
jgi:hypothetical protein